MKRAPYKVRIGISVGLFLWAISCVIAAICFSQMGLMWAAIVGPILAVVAFVFSIVIMPKTNEDGSPVTIEKKPKPKRTKHIVRKNKTPFMSEEEWKEQEEEDDEMMFIEEAVEED